LGAGDQRGPGGAVALLEEPDGTITIQVPITPGPPVAAQLIDAIRARLSELNAAPLAALAELIGHDAAAIGTVEFIPGSAETTAAGDGALNALAAALNRRPRVGVAVESRADAPADRMALARSQVELHVVLATAAAEPQARAAAIDFESPRAQDVLDEFARERLGAERVATIGSLFGPVGQLPAVARSGFYRALFDALAAQERINDAALRRLARFRVRATAGALATRGVDPARVVRSDEEPAADDRTFRVPLIVGP